jgi:hypothetical protein
MEFVVMARIVCTRENLAAIRDLLNDTLNQPPETQGTPTTGGSTKH